MFNSFVNNQKQEATTVRNINKGFTALAAVALLSPFAALEAAAKIEMKIGYPTTADPQHDYAVKFVALVKKRTNGEIAGRTFPTSQLGKIPRQIEGVQLGTQEGFFAPPGFLQGVNKAFQVADVPGLFADHAHAHRSLNVPAFKSKFLALGDKKGMTLSGLWIYDGASYMATTPIGKISDFKGLKIRVLATEIERLSVATLGAAGVPIPFTSVVPSIQRKVVDGARTSLVVAAKAKFPTVTNHLTITNGYYIPCVSAFSQVWLKQLSAKNRAIVLDTADELSHWASARSGSFVNLMIAEWKKSGATVGYFSPAEQKEYMSRLKPLGDKVFANHKNAQIRELYPILKAAAAQMDIR
jgi:TRAP-type C4-dicarboxylate transport system substrate-binding protein